MRIEGQHHGVRVQFLRYLDHPAENLAVRGVNAVEIPYCDYAWAEIRSNLVQAAKNHSGASAVTTRPS
jgi:hypothetical protein